MPCASSRLADGQMFLRAARKPLGRREASRAGLLPCASSSRLADGQMFLRAARKPLEHRGALRAGLLLCASSRWADGQMFLRAARKPLESSRGAAGRAFALRFVTVGRWPNVPQSSAKALGASRDAAAGLLLCASSRLNRLAKIEPILQNLTLLYRILQAE